MKLLLLHTSLRSCGPTNQLRYLLNGLSKIKNYKVIVLLFKKSSLDQSFVNHYSPDFVDFIYIFSLRPSHFKSINRVHSHGFIPDIFALLLKHIKPSLYVISTAVRCEFLADYSFLYGKLPGKALAIIHYNFLSRFDIVVTCSDSINKHLSEIVSPSLLLTIHNGIDLDLIPLSSVDNSIRAHSSLPFGELKILSAAPLVKRKNITLNILYFLNLISSLQISACYHIYGDGPQYTRIKSRFGGHKNIELMGHVSSSCIDYSSYHLFLSLSSSEGFSNSVIEASCHGLHLILSNIPSHIEFSRIYPYCTILDINKLYDPSFHYSLDLTFPSPEELEKHRVHISSNRMVSDYLTIF